MNTEQEREQSITQFWVDMYKSYLDKVAFGHNRAKEFADEATQDYREFLQKQSR